MTIEEGECSEVFLSFTTNACPPALVSTKVESNCMNYVTYGIATAGQYLGGSDTSCDGQLKCVIMGVQAIDAS